MVVAVQRWCQEPTKDLRPDGTMEEEVPPESLTGSSSTTPARKPATAPRVSNSAARKSTPQLARASHGNVNLQVSPPVSPNQLQLQRQPSDTSQGNIPAWQTTIQAMQGTLLLQQQDRATSTRLAAAVQQVVHDMEDIRRQLQHDREQQVPLIVWPMNMCNFSCS